MAAEAVADVVHALGGVGRVVVAGIGVGGAADDVVVSDDDGDRVARAPVVTWVEKWLSAAVTASSAATRRVSALPASRRSWSLFAMSNPGDIR
jgi:hypothetical protein